jgi:enamine deaminase RidA (YjgF/YER057c/UK114 family)
MTTAYPSSTSDRPSSCPPANPPHTIRVEFVVSGIVLVLALCGLAFLAVAYGRAAHDYDKVRSIDALHAQQQAIVDAIDEMRKQTEVLKAQNVRSMDDRDTLHESQGATRESLKEQKASLDRLEETTTYLRTVVETAVAKDAARQKARDEAVKKEAPRK